MLLRMYLRWAENKRYKTVITDMTEGEEAGIKSVTVEVDGPFAYGYLKAEKGTHRLVRLSPYDSNSRRHTSFAKVEVIPVLDEDIDVQIDPNDLQIEVFLSGGAGGQNVQKNATAVRIRHLPTGIVVTCQNERSQTQNRESAMRVLRGKLYDIEQERLEAEKAALRGENVQANFGSQIRNYVLHPYQMVKDLRTNIETGNTGAVLDGDLDMFIEAWLKSQVGEDAWRECTNPAPYGNILGAPSCRARPQRCCKAAYCPAANATPGEVALVRRVRSSRKRVGFTPSRVQIPPSPP